MAQATLSRNYNFRDPDCDVDIEDLYERAFENFLESNGYEPNEEEWEAETNKLIEDESRSLHYLYDEEYYYYE